jgi:hypothetical protein
MVILGLAAHILFSPWLLLVAAGILLWIKFVPARMEPRIWAPLPARRRPSRTVMDRSTRAAVSVDEPRGALTRFLEC